MLKLTQFVNALVGCKRKRALFFHCSTQLLSSSLTLVSGLLAVLSVNVVIVFYIYLALKEPLAKHEPDSGFVAEAKASMKQIA
ncbi:hypothetical protein Syun_010521 [Stephania yunnanensis]|uniref:Uncharacterized protein n=1 Tax=Stephania yunnanensis TaxID=152371 RepID=A0AAP0PQ19_9MAGN